MNNMCNITRVKVVEITSVHNKNRQTVSDVKLTKNLSLQDLLRVKDSIQFAAVIHALFKQENVTF